MNNRFFVNFSGFFHPEPFLLGNTVLFSASIPKLLPLAQTNLEDWYTEQEKQEFSVIRSSKRYAEKLAGKYCAKQALDFFWRRKYQQDLNRLDFSVLSPDQPVQIMAQNPELSSFVQNYHCSISHSADLAVAAVSTESVGIDVEKLRELPEGMLKTILSARELALIRAFLAANFQLPDSLSAIVAFTAKEAVLKAVGCGIAGGLLQVELWLGDEVSKAESHPEIKSQLLENSESSGLFASYQEQYFYLNCLCAEQMFLSLATSTGS